MFMLLMFKMGRKKKQDFRLSSVESTAYQRCSHKHQEVQVRLW